MKHASLHHYIALDIVYVNFISFYYMRVIVSQSLSISEKKVPNYYIHRRPDQWNIWHSIGGLRKFFGQDHQK